MQKKNGKLRIVHDLQPLNAVTYRDAGFPPRVEEFIEEFEGRTIYALLDIFGGYDQYPLDVASRDMTTFQTAIGLMRLTPLPQGATNSVAAYQRMMTWVMRPEIPKHFGVFIDNGGIKGPGSYYNMEVIVGNPLIRHFVFEFAVTLERTFFRLEDSGLTVSGPKIAVSVPELELVGTNVCFEGRKINPKKINKVQRWPRPTEPTEVRAFLGLVTYVRIWIPGFSAIARPLRALRLKDAAWNWTQECKNAFEKLKQKVGQDILLRRLIYGEGAGEIIVAVDSSMYAVGVALFQVDTGGGRRPVRYESITFTPTESRYSQPKLELAGVTKALKKLQHLVWGQHFVLEVDALYLKEMIMAPELPNLPMTRWLNFIQLFDFELWHVPAARHLLPDGLSRVTRDDGDSDAESVEEMIQDYVATRLDSKEWKAGDSMVDRELYVSVAALGVTFWEGLSRYLVTTTRPDGFSQEDWTRMRKMGPKFCVSDRRLWRRNPPNHQEVVFNADRQETFMKGLHDDTGHRGRNETYRRMLERVWWPGMSKDVQEYV